MRKLLAVIVLLAGVCPMTFAASLTVHVRDAREHAVGNAVVTVTSDTATPASSSVSIPPVTHIIDQRNQTFFPYVQLLRPGDQVVFRNSDTTRHQVYSFSPIKRFQFTLHPGESSPPMIIDKVGIAAVGCNIHDRMITYLFVSAAPHIAMSNLRGDADLGDLPPGHYSVQVWHPQLQPGTQAPSKPLDIGSKPAPLELDFSLSLIPDPRERLGVEHEMY